MAIIYPQSITESKGRLVSEHNVSHHIDALTRNRCVVKKRNSDGADEKYEFEVLTDSSSNTTITIARGRVLFDGYLIDIDTLTQLDISTITVGVTKYILLEVSFQDAPEEFIDSAQLVLLDSIPEDLIDTSTAGFVKKYMLLYNASGDEESNVTYESQMIMTPFDLDSIKLENDYVSNSGMYQNLSSFLEAYLKFINTSIRGLNDTDPWSQVNEPRSITIEGENGIYDRLRVNTGGTEDFINEKIFDGNTHPQPTAGVGKPGDIVSLDSNSLFPAAYIPAPKTVTTESTDLINTYKGGVYVISSADNVLSIDANGKLTSKAEVNQNAYSIINGMPATSKTDSFTFTAGSNISLTTGTKSIEIGLTGVVPVSRYLTDDTGTPRWEINQNLLTTSYPTFGNLTIGIGESKTLLLTSANVFSINNSVNISGGLTVSGTITGSKVYNAVWNDYAEWYKKDADCTYEPGDIIAKIPGKDSYGLSTSDNERLCVGVCSDTYGHILGGDALDNMEDNKDNFIPVAVSGRVRVKVLGPVMEGQFIIASSVIPGVGVASNSVKQGCTIGKALETSNDINVKKVLMQIILG